MAAPSPHICTTHQDKPLAEDLDLLVAAADYSSRRSRWLTIVLTLACIITFFAAWNVLDMGWLPSRLALIDAAQRYHLATPSERDQMTSPGAEAARFVRARAFLEAKGMLDAHKPTVRIPIVTSAAGGPTTTSIASVDLNDVELLVMRHLYEEAKLQSLVVLGVPFLGVAFDINDLGLMAGIAFVIILIMRGMSISSEYFALRHVFAAAFKKSCLRNAYELIAMRQVLSVPLRDLETHAESGKVPIKVWFYRSLPMAINLAPLAILVMIYLINVYTRDVGVMISPENTGASLWITRGMMVFVVILLYRNVTAEIRLHRLFDAVALCEDTKLKKALNL